MKRIGTLVFTAIVMAYFSWLLFTNSDQFMNTDCPEERKMVLSEFEAVVLNKYIGQTRSFISLVNEHEDSGAIDLTYETSGFIHQVNVGDRLSKKNGYDILIKRENEEINWTCTFECIE